MWKNNSKLNLEQAKLEETEDESYRRDIWNKD